MTDSRIHDPGYVQLRIEGLRGGSSDWPPVDSEVLWARSIAADRFLIDNIPFYARNLAYLDTVSARPSADDGVLTLERVLSRSGHSTYRIKCRDDVESQAACEVVLRMLEAAGCGYEGAKRTLYAIDLPPSVDVHRIYALLEEKERDGVLEFEEGYYHRDPDDG